MAALTAKTSLPSAESSSWSAAGHREALPLGSCGEHQNITAAVTMVSSTKICTCLGIHHQDFYLMVNL
jgi:hypothetical protein